MAVDDAFEDVTARAGAAAPLRVLFCLPDLSTGGAQKSTLRLIGNLDRSRFEPKLLVHVRDGCTPDHIPAKVPVVFCLENESQPALWRYLLLLYHTLRAARDRDLLVAAMEGRTAFITRIAGWIVRRPVIGWIRTDWSMFKQFVSRRILRSTRILRTMPRVLCVTRGAADAASELFGIDRSRIDVIYNGHDLNRLATRAAEQPLPQDAPWLGSRTIIAVGRLVTVKGFDVLIRAFAEVVRTLPDSKLVIVGDGEQHDALADQARQLGVADRVYLTGHRDNPLAMMSRCGVFALSSRAEGCANVLIEAMACGTAIVATQCPSGPQELLEGGVGLLTPPEDHARLAAALTRVLGDDALRSELSARSLARANDFPLHLFVEKISRVMERTVTSRQRIRGDQGVMEAQEQSAPLAG